LPQTSRDRTDVRHTNNLAMLDSGVTRERNETRPNTTATRRALIALSSAPLLAASQSPWSWAPLALVALAPWMWATRRCSYCEAVLLSTLVGTAYGCLVAPWIPEALRALGSSGLTPWLGLIGTAAWAKLPMFAVGGFSVWLLRNQPSGIQILGTGATFFAAEWAIGAWSLGVPWALVGHSQLPVTGVSQLAAVGGVPLISACLVATSAAVNLAIERRRGSIRIAIALVAGWCVMGLAARRD